jgi:hypothetical protein
MAMQDAATRSLADPFIIVSFIPHLILVQVNSAVLSAAGKKKAESL